MFNAPTDEPIRSDHVRPGRLLQFGVVFSRSRCIWLAAAVALIGAVVALPIGGAAASTSERYLDSIFPYVSVTHDISYGRSANLEGQSVPLTLDLYQPAGDDAAARPAIVWVHGGGYTSGDKSSPELVDEATTFAKKGYVNISINYRLEPQGCSAAAPTAACVKAIVEADQDAQTAVRWLRTNAPAYRVDPTRIAMGGSSAGAITALNVDYLNNDPASAIEAAVSLSGANILGHPRPSDAPALLFHGTADTYVPYQWAVNAVIAARSVRLYARLVTWPGAGHVPYSQHRDQILRISANFLYLHFVKLPNRSATSTS